LLALGRPCPGLAAELAVRTSFPELVRGGAPVPVLVDMRSGEPRFRGTLEAWTGTPDESRSVRRVVDIGPGSFRFTLYPPAASQYVDRVHVRLLVDGREVFATSRRLSRVDRVGARVAIVPEPGSALRGALNEALARRLSRLGPPVPPALAGVAVESLPDRWYGFAAADVVLWNCSQVVLDDPERQRALAAWVRGGGRLVLAVDTGDTVFRSPVPDLVADANLVTSDGRLGHPAFAAADSGSATLAPWLSRRCGFGVVCLVTDGWAELAAWEVYQWRALVGVPSSARPAPPPPADAGRAIAGDGPEGSTGALLVSLGRMAGYGALSFAPILTAGILYLLVISLIDYLVLRRLRRQGWTWISFPLAIAGFSAVAYAAFDVRDLRSGETYTYELVDVAADGRTVRETAYICAPARAGAAVSVKAPADRLLTPLEEATARHGRGMLGGEQGRVRGARTTALTETDHGQVVTFDGTSAAFNFARREHVDAVAEPPFAAALRADGWYLEGEIQRNWPVSVTAATLWYDGAFYEVSRGLAPGRRLGDLSRALDRMARRSPTHHGEAGSEQRIASMLLQHAMARVAAEAVAAPHAAERRDGPVFDHLSPAAGEGVLIVVGRHTGFHADRQSVRMSCVRQLVNVGAR
jgi:hypothetical protein